MPIRSSVGELSSSTRDPEPEPEVATASSTAKDVLTLALIAVGTAAVAYAVERYAESDERDVETAVETIRNRTTAAVPTAVEERVPDAVPVEGQSIPIVDELADELAADEGDAGEGEPEADTDADPSSDEAGLDAETNVDLADERSPEEIAERATDEIQTDPAEPGEMTVDDEVENVIDDVEDAIDEVGETDTGAEAEEDRDES